jgi:serine/threonine protein kinase
MTNDNNNKSHAKTALSQPMGGDGASFANSSQQSAPLSSSHKKALTEIESSFNSHHTQQGFADAKKNADQALADNQIILNHRFVLKESLGAGGMGTVYKAQDLRKVEARDINPYVATKILNSDFKNHPDAFISLQREASRSHLLSHPNIVTVHDFDRDGDTIYMTMELLEGEDLETLIARHKNVGLPIEKALTIFGDYCVALEFAHNKGIIHSDFKPGNVFVTKSEGTKVLDFGIARLALESKTKDHFDAGRIGAITPAYASLEMIGHKPPAASDDVFAAAIILYELLTGTHPFGGLSAGAALVKGIKPKRIGNLSKRQWEGLSQALELKREDRTAKINDFMLAITETDSFPLYRTFSIVLVLILGWVGYHQFIAPNELNQVIDDTLLKANECFVKQDYQCTIESANAILEMAPEHEIAKQLVNKGRIQQQLTLIEQCLTTEENVDCTVVPLEKLKKSTNDPELIGSLNGRIKKRSNQLFVAKNILAAQSCFEKQDYACAEKTANAILELEPSESSAMKLRQQSQQAMLKEKQQSLQLDSAFALEETKANLCFKQKRFGCAQTHAKQALALKPDEHEMEELMQNAAFAQKQQQQNLNRANKILKDGRRCLRKLDYSCAIAKSESALEFVPSYKSALQLKHDATESMKRAKKNIEIE